MDQSDWVIQFRGSALVRKLDEWMLLVGWLLVRNNSGLYSDAVIFQMLICFCYTARAMILKSARV